MSEGQIALLFDAARAELDKIDSQAHGAKKRVVQDLAKKLEGKLHLKDIAEEIAHQLDGKVSKTLVYASLDAKYKKETKPKKIPQVESPPEQEITISNSGKQEVVSNPYSPGAKPDRNATYTEKQAFKIQELGASLKTALAENAELKKHVDKSGYNADVTQELLDAQIRIKELKEENQKLKDEIAQLKQPFDAPTTVDFAGKRLKGASAHVRPANREVPIVTVPEAVIPAGAF